MKRCIFRLPAVLAFSVWGAAAKADAFEDIFKGVVRIATLLDVPPFGSQNEKREPEG